jgi:hypothetical protein
LSSRGGINNHTAIETKGLPDISIAVKNLQFPSALLAALIRY